MKKCLNCGNDLAGRQRKYCSIKCKNVVNNQLLQSYQAQQARGRKRKLQLLELKGNRCELCGYSKNHAALEFRHKNPQTKKFQLDLRSLSNRSWDVIAEELKKCVLLCSNCHAELHNPDCMLK